MTHIYLPMETFNREYWGKMALTCQLAEQGHSVTIGYNHRVRQAAISSNEEAVFYETKGKLSRTMEHLDTMRARGIKLVGQDEEAGISYSDFAEFKKGRPEVEGVGYFDCFFAWGQPDYQTFLKYSEENRIKQTGSPRTLFWGEFGAEFFSDEVKVLRKKYGTYILVISNTTAQNSIVSKRQSAGIAWEMNYDSKYLELLKKREVWEKETYHRTLESINEILEKTKFNVLIRPHPVEDISIWLEKFKGNPRVFVDKAGSGTPVVIASEGVVHAGSTLGLEAIFHEKKTVSLRGIIRAEESRWTADDFSHNINKIGDLVPTLLSGSSFEENYKELKYLITCWSDTSVLNNQAESILSPRSKGESPASLNTDAIRAKQQSRTSKYWRRIRYGKSPVHSLHSNKRPQINQEVFSKDFLRLQKQLNFGREVLLKEISESTFCITPEK